MSDKEAVVAIRGFVAASAKNNVPEWCTHGLAEGGERHGSGCLVGGLLARVGLGFGGVTHVDYFLGAVEEVNLVIYLGLGKERDPVLIIGLPFCLSHVVA